MEASLETGCGVLGALHARFLLFHGYRILHTTAKYSLEIKLLHTPQRVVRNFKSEYYIIDQLILNG